MELHVVDTEGIPEGCVLSVRAGATRRQAPVAADRPFRFTTSVADSVPFKVDVLEPVATARLILRPGEEQRPDCQYTIPLEASNSFEGSGPPAAERRQQQTDTNMSVTIAVRPTDEKSAKDDDDGPSSRPGTSPGGKRGVAGSASASRLGQASAAREYLDKHNLVEFTQLLVQSVIKEQPERPYEFMAQQFYFPVPEPRRTGSAGATGTGTGAQNFGATMATIGAHGGGR
eukprot:TRINITY_DN60018_c0_g1_i1.p1 TRINITY_DN60018_c0_g1~~TRINITY_DN60018_c0_g1_i1.p1  ORF type:complete len:230 (-),score=35.39 TRINITY_DN60018_c0_g1_i1:463-1152(-)